MRIRPQSIDVWISTLSSRNFPTGLPNRNPKRSKRYSLGDPKKISGREHFIQKGNNTNQTYANCASAMSI